MGLLGKKKKKEEVEIAINEENFGSIAGSILSFFGISEENMKSVKSILSMIKTTEYSDRTEVEIDMKKIKITISK